MTKYQPLPPGTPTASDYCKANGLDSLQELAKITGQSYQTLNNWYLSEKKGDLFRVVVAGAAALKKAEK